MCIILFISTKYTIKNINSLKASSTEHVWSVTATLLDDHVLVVPQGQLVVLIVEHGERAEVRGHTGRAAYSVGMVESQQALEDTRTWITNYPRPLIHGPSSCPFGVFHLSYTKNLTHTIKLRMSSNGLPQLSYMSQTFGQVQVSDNSQVMCSRV